MSSTAVYSARSSIGQKDAEAVVEALRSITKDLGRLDSVEQAAELVERSRPKTSPTHHLFEWDDKKAADAHRISRARQIIMSIQVTFEEAPERPVRAFPSIRVQGKQGYFPMEKILRDEKLTAALLEQAEVDLTAWSRRYSTLQDVATLKGVFEVVRGFQKHK
jgi:hypothetical protein